MSRYSFDLYLSFLLITTIILFVYIYKLLLRRKLNFLDVENERITILYLDDLYSFFVVIFGLTSSSEFWERNGSYRNRKTEKIRRCRLVAKSTMRWLDTKLERFVNLTNKMAKCNYGINPFNLKITCATSGIRGRLITESLIRCNVF